MILCPNFSSPEVARAFEELKLATSELAAYAIWSLNGGNSIDRAPNGAPSKLFLTLLEYYKGDRTKAIQAKAKTYGKSFLLWFGNWTEQRNTRPLVKFYGPTMGKTTAAKSNPRIVDFDDIVREDIKKLANKKGISVRLLKTQSPPEYIQLLKSAIEKWRSDDSNIGKILVVSNAALAKEDIFDNRVSIPSREEFIRRQVERSKEDRPKEELIKEAEDYYDDLMSKWYDNPVIENNYVSDLEQDASKVVDENGEPLMVWHGSKELFNIVDFDKSDDDLSFFVTDSRLVAKEYSGNEINERLRDASREDRHFLKSEILGALNKIQEIESEILTGVRDDEFLGSYELSDSAIKSLKEKDLPFWQNRLRELFRILKETKPGAIHFGYEMPLFFLSKNPLVIDNAGSWNAIEFEGKTYTTRELAKLAKDRKYDGVIIHNISDRPDSDVTAFTRFGEYLGDYSVYIGFSSPNQFKSINNNGDFSKLNNDIFYSYDQSLRTIAQRSANVDEDNETINSEFKHNRPYNPTSISDEMSFLLSHRLLNVLQRGNGDSRILRVGEHSVRFNVGVDRIKLAIATIGGHTRDFNYKKTETGVLVTPRHIDAYEKEGGLDRDEYRQGLTTMFYRQLLSKQYDDAIDSAVRKQLQEDPESTPEKLKQVRIDAAYSWAEQRQSEILGDVQLRIAEAFGLHRNEDGSWSIDGNGEVDKLRLEFVKSLGDHAGHISVANHAEKAMYLIKIGLLEGDGSTFNHELAHYYIRTFWKSKLVQDVVQLVYNKHKHGDIDSDEGKRAVEEAVVDYITERSVDNMFDVKLANKGRFQRFWEGFNLMLYKVFNFKSKVAQNAILDQITKSFLVNEQLAEAKSEAKFVFLNQLMNQSLYQQRRQGQERITYPIHDLAAMDEDLIKLIVEGTARKQRLYESRSTASASTIYGDARQMALNLDAVRRVKIASLYIHEARIANDAIREIKAKNKLFMKFIEDAMYEVTRLSEMLDNAAANEYRKLTYSIDSGGNRIYKDASQSLESRDFTYDELEYVRDVVLGHIEPIISGIQSLLQDAKTLGYSDDQINQIQSALLSTLIVDQIKHVVTRYENGVNKLLYRWIDETVDARDELDNEFKNRLKINMRKWLNDQFEFGDVSRLEVFIGLGQHSSSPVVKAMQDMINDMVDEREAAVYEKGNHLRDLFEAARKHVSLKYSLFGINFLKMFMQLDRRGLPTGNFIDEYNDGQYKIDFENYRDEAAFGKTNSLQSKLRKLLNDDSFELQFDEDDFPIAPDQPGVELLVKDYLKNIEQWKSKNAVRQFTSKYYTDRIDTLSLDSLRAINRINRKMQDIKRACTVNGVLRLDLLTQAQEDELHQLELEKEFLGSIYTPDGVLKEEDSVEFKIAQEISQFSMLTKGKIQYTYDKDSYEQSKNNSSDPNAFDMRYSHWQINPKLFLNLMKVRYAHPTYNKLIQQLNLLQKSKYALINIYRGQQVGEIKWYLMFDKGGVLKVEKFFEALKDLDERIANVSASIRDFIDTLSEDEKNEMRYYIGGELHPAEVLDDVMIPADISPSDTPWSKRQSVYQNLRNAIIARINSDDSLTKELKNAAILREFSKYEYFNPNTRTTMPLSIFSTSIALFDTFDLPSELQVNSYERIPSGLFSKIDRTASSSEYVNKDFDQSKGVGEYPAEHYKDERFDRIVDPKNKPLFDYYKALRDTAEESWKAIPFLGAYDGRLPQIHTSVPNIFGRNKWHVWESLKYLWKYETEILEDDRFYHENEVGRRDPSGLIRHNIPIRFVDRLESPEYIKSDLLGSVMKMYEMSKNWEIKSKKLSFFTQLYLKVKGNKALTRQTDVIQGITKRQLYETRTLGFAEVNANNKWLRAIKTLTKMRAVSQLSLLANNISSALVSFLDPFLTLTAEALNKKYLNKTDFAYSLAMLFGNIEHALSIGKVRSNNKVKQLMQKLRLDERVVESFLDNDKSQLRRFVTSGLTMKWFSWGDYTMKALYMIATMHHFKAYERPDKTIVFLPRDLYISTAMKDGMSLNDAEKKYNSIHTANLWGVVSFKNSRLVVKDKYKDAVTERTWSMIQRAVQSRSSLATGVVSEEERTLMLTDSVASFFTMMRNFLITGWWDRFKIQNDFLMTTFDSEGNSTYSNIDSSKTVSPEEAYKDLIYYSGGLNWSTRKVEDGVYRSAYRWIKRTWPNLKFMIQNAVTNAIRKGSDARKLKLQDSNVAEYDLYAVSRILTEFAIILALSALAPISKAGADDDKDNYWKQFIYLINVRLSVERLVYYNPVTLGELISSPTAALSAVNRMLKIFSLVLEMLGLGKHDLDEDVKSGNFYNEKRWKYDLINITAPFGTYNWYTNMPEEVGGGGAKTIRRKSRFYDNFANFFSALFTDNTPDEDSNSNGKKKKKEKKLKKTKKTL